MGQLVDQDDLGLSGEGGDPNAVSEAVVSEYSGDSVIRPSRIDKVR